MTSTLTAADVLAMPLAELRERVDLAERLAIAARHASTSGGVAASPATASTTTTQPAPAGKPAAAAAPKAAPKAAPAAAAAPAQAAPADDFAEDALSGSVASGDFEVGGDDDMLAGFVEEITPEDAKVKAVEIAKQVISKKDTNELAIARGIMQKYGVSKVSEVAAGKEVELYNDFKTGFPQYAG